MIRSVREGRKAVAISDTALGERLGLCVLTLSVRVVHEGVIIDRRKRTSNGRKDGGQA